MQDSRPAPKIFLDDTFLWDKFREFGTEMIVTKNGRRMFPSIKLRMRDLDPSGIYWLLLEISPADRNRYKFCKNEWIVSGSADSLRDESIRHRFYVHPASPSTGNQWMSNPISFLRLKLTNNKSAPLDQIILNSLHKYRPIVHIIASDSATAMLGASHLDGIFKASSNFKNVWSFPLNEAEFIAVTAYQNSEDNLISHLLDYEYTMLRILPSPPEQCNAGLYKKTQLKIILKTGRYKTVLLSFPLPQNPI